MRFDTSPEDWWDGLDADVLECLAARGPMAPAELGRCLGISEGAAASALSMLAQAGKVRIRLVELPA
jgi:predicted transcriptional regulator